jgi:hypothetical protein
MSEDHSSPIPGKLRAEGFSVSTERMEGARAKELWCASASRDGISWTAFGEVLDTVLMELERQIQEDDGDSREMIGDEMLETARQRLQAG